jgi:MtN3 and saliva related transmembrane protein
MALTAFSIDDLIGYIAAALTTASFIPQAWLTWKTRRADGMSLGMYCIYTIGVSLWLTYGLLIHTWPVIIANAITLALAFPSLA